MFTSSTLKDICIDTGIFARFVNGDVRPTVKIRQHDCSIIAVQQNDAILKAASLAENDRTPRRWVFFGSQMTRVVVALGVSYEKEPKIDIRICTET